MKKFSNRLMAFQRWRFPALYPIHKCHLPMRVAISTSTPTQLTN